MDALRNMFTRFGATWSRLGPNQRLSAGAVMLFAASAAIALVFWARRPDFVPLYGRLEAEDAASVVDLERPELHLGRIHFRGRVAPPGGL